MHKLKATKKTITKKKVKKRKSLQKEFSWKKFIFKLACFSFFLIVIYTLFYSKLTTIRDVFIDGNIAVSSDLIIQQINSQTQEKNLLYISRKNFFFVSEDNLKKLILETFPKIKDVEIKKVFPNQISVSVIEYDLIPVVCIESQQGRCFILENDGTILGDANFDSPKLKENKTVVIIDKNKDDIVKFGKEFISEEKLNNIIFLGDELTYSLNTKIKQPYIIPARGADEVRFNTSEGWYLKVDIADNPKITLKVLDLFFEKGLKENIRRYDLEYVDSRTNEKIYYKYNKKDEIIEEESVEDEDKTDDDKN